MKRKTVHQSNIDKVHAQFNAKFVTNEMKRNDTKGDVTFEIASTNHPKNCPKCNLKTLYACTWIVEISSKNRVLCSSCVRCAETVFEGHATNGDIIDLGHHSVDH